jgi:hypothetical protein
MNILLQLCGRQHLKECLHTLSYLLAAALFPSLWHAQVTHSFALKAFAVYVFLSAILLIHGRLFLRLASFAFKINTGLSLQFLCGYFLFNTLGFVLAIATPFSLYIDVLILFACGVLGLLFCPRRATVHHERDDLLPNLLCLFLSGAGATLWCADSLNPVLSNGGVTIFQMWGDGFFHAREISTLSEAHGLQTMSNIQMSGTPASVYHYAAYLMPAVVSSLTGTGAYEVFSSFEIPFGILITGLAAFSLASSIWGMWPGTAATIAVVLLPDAYQQGFQNKLMSYNFVQQVNPGGLYGVAILALAWIFILDGCKTGKFTAIFFGYLIALISVVYKAQFFVANSFLIMVYPCLFIRGLKTKWRLAMAILLVSFFAYVIYLSQQSNFIPTLRLDGSFSRHYARLILSSYDAGFFMPFFFRELVGQPPLVFDTIMAGMILVTTFGLWVVACALIFFLPGKKPDRAAHYFPLFVILNYLVMAVGLAGDTKRIGMPEELVHRPLVWAYYAVAAWTGAALYASMMGNTAPTSRAGRIFAAAFVFASLTVPLSFSAKLQTMAIWPGFADYRTFNSFPTSYVDACLYIRKHSHAGEIIQDSENDTRLALTGLAERQDFAAYDKAGRVQLRTPEGLRERVRELELFKNITNAADVTAFLRDRKISWYLLQPGTKVAWPPSFLESAVFNSMGYKVYHIQM